jgi:pyrroloquinoline quinone biosynthesis protein E
MSGNYDMPLGILAELTHRCPLQCGYCSNPLELLKADRELDTATWLDVFRQAAELGILQVHLSGGEPALRQDLEEMVSCLSRAGIYTNLITAAVTLNKGRLESLKKAGLDHIQISFQGATVETTERIGHYKNAFAKKTEVARLARDLELPLTVNAPIHRLNIREVPAFVDLALELDAERLEIANVQYYGWAELNKAALLPSRDRVAEQVEFVTAARERLTGILNIDFVPPDYYADYPKPCMGGWAKDAFVIAPDGTMLPCHAAQSITSLRFSKVTEGPLGDIWEHSESFNAYRGTDWMPERCKVCPRKEIDFGGCRCQAFAVTGNAADTDPACIKSPFHEKLADLPEIDAVQKRVIGYRA